MSFSITRLFSVLIFLIVVLKSQAQVESYLTNDHAWLKGNYVEIGINEKGVYGADLANKPVSFHSNRDIGGTGLFGFISNPQADGWVDYDGDFFIPGRAEEGFCIEIDAVNYNNNNVDSFFEISGSITDVSTITSNCLDDVAQIIWEGAVDGIAVMRSYNVTENGLFIRMVTTLKNRSAVTKSNVYFMHNVDPDNNQFLSGFYETQMDLLAQASSPTDSISLIRASQPALLTPLDMDGSFISFFAEDARARVTYGGFGNRSASNVWNGVGVNNLEGASSLGPIDRAISIAFNVGDMLPDEEVVFEYYYVFGDIDDTFSVPYIGVVDLTFEHPTRCDPEDGKIYIASLNPDTQYTISYDYDGSTTIPQDFITDANGTLVISNLEAGTYTNFNISYLSCNVLVDTQIDLVGSSLPIANPVEDQVLCDVDTDFITVIDLSVYNTTILGTQSATDFDVSYHDSLENLIDNVDLPYSYTTNGLSSFQIFARLKNKVTHCFDYTFFNVLVGIPPQFLLNDVLLCLNSDGSINLDYSLPIIDTFLSETDYNFEWYLEGGHIPGENGSYLEVMEQGLYTVKTINKINGCEYTNDIAYVSTSAPPSDLDVVITSSSFSSNHTIEIIASGIGTYEYKIDNGLYQSSPYFNNMTPGHHVIYINDINGCGEKPFDITLIDYPEFFTPNADGFNDYWQIIGVEALINPVIYIFDRYGKLLKQLSSQSQGWDGTYNGHVMPTSDYWFKVVFEDINNIQREFTAHFTLKR